MKLVGEQRIEAERQTVWRALNDPEILRQCIPGCESLTLEEEGRFTATVAIKVGPIGARFAGTVILSDVEPPSSYTLSGEGQGGIAGSARGSARVRLEDEAGATRLHYVVDAQVGGRLAQLGGAIIDATAKQLSGRFFARFAELACAVDQAPVLPPAVEAPVAGVAPSGEAQVAASPAGHAFRVNIAAPASRAGITPLILVVALAGFAIGRLSAGGGLSGGVVPSLLALLGIVALAGFEIGWRMARPHLSRAGQHGEGSVR